MIYLAILGLAFICYLTSMNGDFLFDDYTSFLSHIDIRRGKIKRTVRYLFLRPRALLWLSYLLNLKYAGWIYAHDRTVNEKRQPEPIGFHIVNVAIHAVNGMLCVWIMQSLALPWRTAQLAGILFVCHPLAVNAVANISGRSSSLAAVPYFIGIGCALHHLHILAFIMIPIALQIKEDTAILSWVYAGIGLRSGDDILFVGGMLLACNIAFFGLRRFNRISDKTGERTLQDVGFPPSPIRPEDYLRTVFTETVFRLPQWIIGWNLQIDVDIAKPPIRRQTIAAVGVTIGIMVIALLSIQRPVGVLLIITIISPLFIYPLIQLPDPIAEHRAYCSLMGISGLLAMLLAAI